MKSGSDSAANQYSDGETMTHVPQQAAVTIKSCKRWAITGPILTSHFSSPERKKLTFLMSFSPFEDTRF